MSYSVTEIKTGIANALATIPGLRAYAQQPDNLNAPFAWPMLDSITYNGAMRGGLVTHIYPSNRMPTLIQYRYGNDNHSRTTGLHSCIQ